MAIKKLQAGEVPGTGRGGILVVYGFPGVGKSQFCIDSADVAEPLFFANFDRSADHLLKAYKGKEYYYDEFTALHQAQGVDCLARIVEMKNAAMSVGKGVFVIDNMAALWDIVKIAKLPAEDKPAAKTYAEANQWLRDLMLGLERSGLWVVFTAPPKEIWTGARTSTGLYEAEGWKHSSFHTLAELWLFTNQPIGAQEKPMSGATVGELELPANAKPKEYRGQIMVAKRRPSVEGMIMKSPTLAKLLRAMKELE